MNNTVYVLMLTLPLPPNIANARQHWRVKLKTKKAYWETLNQLLVARRIPSRERTFSRTHISARVIVGGQMDTDNLFARLKWALDWLQRMGYIASDAPSCLYWSDIPTQEVSRKKPPTVTFTLTTIAE